MPAPVIVPVPLPEVVTVRVREGGGGGGVKLTVAWMGTTWPLFSSAPGASIDADPSGSAPEK